MAISDHSIALASIISSATIAVFGIVAPLGIHFSDRRHDAKLRLANKRETTYLKLAHVISAARNADHEKALKLGEEMVGLMSIWPTQTVRDLFEAWLKLLPTAYGPDKNDAQDKIVFEAGEKLRKQMASEVQMTKRS